MFKLINSLNLLVTRIGGTITPSFAGEAGDAISEAVNTVWMEVYDIIKSIGTPLATATFAVSAFYFFIIGRDKNYLDKAKGLMVGSGVGLAIIYLAPTIVEAFVKIFAGF